MAASVSLRLRLGHRQPWSWLTDEREATVASIQQTDPGKGVPGGLQLKLTEPVLSLVQAVAMAEFAWTRIGALRSKTT